MGKYKGAPVLVIDTVKSQSVPVLTFNVQDYNSAEFIIQVRRDGAVLPLADTTARLYIRKPDGTTVFRDCPVTDDVAGEITVTLTSNMLAASGVVVCEFFLYDSDGSEIAVSRKFKYFVENSLLTDGAVESSNDFSSLSNLITNAEQLISDVQVEKTAAQTAAAEAQQSAEQAQTVVSNALGTAQLKTTAQTVKEAINENYDKVEALSNDKNNNRYKDFVISRHRNITAKLRLQAFKGMMVGDSICQGTGSSSAAKTIASQFGGKMYTSYGFSGNDWTPRNYGVGGSTISQCLAYLSHTLNTDNELQQGYAFQYPYWVFVTGRNDCTHFDGSIGTFSKLYRMAVRMGIRAGIDIICMTEPPVVNMTTGEIEDPNYPAFADEIRLIASQEGASLVDTHAEFLYRKDVLGEDIRDYSSDGVHPNDDGYQIMADLLFRCVNGKGVPLSLQNSKFEPDYLGHYAMSQYNTSALSNASLLTLSSIGTYSTSRKEVLGTQDCIEIQSGGYADFRLPRVNGSFVLLTMMSMSASGTATLQCPVGFSQRTGMQALAGVNREFTYAIQPPVDPNYPLQSTVRVLAVGGTIRITGVHYVAPVLTSKHTTVKGAETGTWSTVNTSSFDWRRSNTIGSTVEIKWYGTDLTLDVLRGVDKGVLGYKTDTESLQTYDAYLNASPLVQGLQIAKNLSLGWHTTTLSVETKTVSASDNRIDLKNVRTYSLIPTTGRLVANIDSGITVFSPDGVSYVRSQTGIPFVTNNQITNTVSSVIETVR